MPFNLGLAVLSAALLGIFTWVFVPVPELSTVILEAPSTAHLWPVLKPLLFALVIQNARRGVMMTSGLAFLGLMDPRLPNWGSLLFESQDQMHSDAFWWLLLPPVAALSCLLLFLTYLQQKVSRNAA